MIPLSLVVVDVETTGTNPKADRITEVAVLEAYPSGTVAEWASLVNPGVPIPEFISAMTGITDAMVRKAPTFDTLAAGLHARLGDKLLVAHNAPFDHGMLRAEFARAGYTLKNPALCTVRLSRTLYPQYSSHSLNALIERHALPVQDRHRALGDVRVLWRFLQHVQREFPPDILVPLIQKLSKGLIAESDKQDDEFSDLMGL